jgi:hypothetical protein
LKKLTIAIPTTGKRNTIVHSIKSILQNEEDFILLISINATFPDKDILNNISAIEDNRIKIIYTYEDLSMKNHYEFILNNFDSEWVTFIGDDDGMLNFTVSYFYKLLSIHDFKVIKFDSLKYFWPEAQNNLINRIKFNLSFRNADVYIPKIQKIKIVYEKTDLVLKQLTNGLRRYNSLPMLYQGGFIHQDIINKCKIRNKFFHGPVPDLFSAFAISVNITEYLHVKIPLIIEGISIHSIGMSQFTNKSKNLNPEKDFENKLVNEQTQILDIPKMNRFIKSIPLLELQSLLICDKIYKKNTIDYTIKNQLIRALVQTNSFRPELITRVKYYCNEFNLNFHNLYFISILLKPFVLLHTIFYRIFINRYAQLYLKNLCITNINDATFHLSKVIKDTNFEK